MAPSAPNTDDRHLYTILSAVQALWVLTALTYAALLAYEYF